MDCSVSAASNVLVTYQYAMYCLVFVRFPSLLLYVSFSQYLLASVCALFNDNQITNRRGTKNISLWFCISRFLIRNKPRHVTEIAWTWYIKYRYATCVSLGKIMPLKLLVLLNSLARSFWKIDMNYVVH